MGSLFEQADFVKIALPPRREPQSGGSGGSANVTYFFIIFSPGTIDHLGATFLSTALMEREQKILLNDLVRLFPTVVVIEIDALIEQIQTIIIQVTSAIELISILVLLCGALVLVACVNASLDERFHENAILRTLGAGRKLILSSL